MNQHHQKELLNGFTKNQYNLDVRKQVTRRPIPNQQFAYRVFVERDRLVRNQRLRFVKHLVEGLLSMSMGLKIGPLFVYDFFPAQMLQ